MTLIFDLIKYGGDIPIPNVMYGIVYFFLQLITLVFGICYFHQFIYIIISVIRRPRPFAEAKRCHKLGIVISARNEENVRPTLIESIRSSDYPTNYYEIFVIADNCTDNTANVCRALGCSVIERFDTTRIGKGYALNYFFTKLHTDSTYQDKIPEAYIIIDADNTIDVNFLREMNKSFDAGYEMVTSYRNSSNFCDNWISAGYGYWFLHEAQHLNKARMLTGNSSTVLGTGFLISTALVKKYDNYNFSTLTEDVEVSDRFVLDGGTIAYNSEAEIYDEQPTSFKQSWRQRERWAKGYYQVMRKYGKKLMEKSAMSFSCWDVFTDLAPVLILSIAIAVGLVLGLIISLLSWNTATIILILKFTLMIGVEMYLLLALIGGLLCLTEWKKIKGPKYKKILYVFTLPLFIFTYLPIAITAIFKKVEWSPIKHKGK